MTIKNTLAFEPTITETFGATITPADIRGQIFAIEGDIAKGQEIVSLIKESDDTFLVSKPAFDCLCSLGFKNVCMFDPSKTVYDGERAIAQGGLLFS